jgi:ABC-type lipoprotein release transport system permease subunit
VAVGVAVGLAAAAAGARVLETLLYEVEPLDPSVYAGVATTVVLAAALACWIPAATAATVSPTVALRSEQRDGDSVWTP